MSLMIAMLPLYIFGNLHCLGMCGPLVMMIGHHRYRYFYFLGRLLSFTLAGGIAGGVGAVAGVFFNRYHIGQSTSLFFGALLLLLGIYTLLGWSYPGHAWLGRRLAGVNQTLSLLMLRDRIWPTFMFGFFTLALPCGQTLIVFSACALSGDFYVGLLNGFAFALLTSPSLFLAMQAHLFLRQLKPYYQSVVGISALFVGGISILRGLAESGIISHWVIYPFGSHEYHLAIF